MVKAEFVKKPARNLVVLIGCLCFMAWVAFSPSVDEATRLSMLVFGSLISIVLITFLLFNLGAHLSVDEQYIKGRYHYFKKIQCPVAEVAYALAGTNTLLFQLKSGKKYTIRGIANSYELCSVIRRNMPFEALEQPEEMIKDVRNSVASQKRNAACVLVGVAMLFVNLFIAVYLTGEREMHEFSQTDWLIMAVMGVVEIVTIIVTFRVGNVAGMGNFPVMMKDYLIRRTIIETKPLIPGYIIGVYADEDYTGRVTVYGYPNEDAVYFTVQKITPEYALTRTYTSETYESQEQIPEDLESLVDITKIFYK